MFWLGVDEPFAGPLGTLFLVCILIDVTPLFSIELGGFIFACSIIDLFKLLLLAILLIPLFHRPCVLFPINLNDKRMS